MKRCDKRTSKSSVQIPFRPPFHYRYTIQMPDTMVTGIWRANYLNNKQEKVLFRSQSFRIESRCVNLFSFICRPTWAFPTRSLRRTACRSWRTGASAIWRRQSVSNWETLCAWIRARNRRLNSPNPTSGYSTLIRREFPRTKTSKTTQVSCSDLWKKFFSGTWKTPKI